jgi:hypothetical protein
MAFRGSLVSALVRFSFGSLGIGRPWSVHSPARGGECGEVEDSRWADGERKDEVDGRDIDEDW